ncbi:MAG: tRNA preQ1(34) S-adenosylmethionine ribosyltransferase-isomerase QueA [Deltaproteobacteria bacterium]|nr:tRNA preQ1(34) S-adenosylmethionine ribosyltransferase-isomerase QueA [Deltaproteobacteria bacterium]
MRTSLLDYALPETLIASRPLERRDGARLMVVGATLAHRRVDEWAALVPEGALVVLNETRVRKARLFGTRRGTGGRAELLLLRRLSEPGHKERWLALGRASKPLRPGSVIDAGALSIEVRGRDDADGALEVEVSAGGSVDAALEEHGHVPIPPYLRRDDDALDRERYQTVFARELGSVAAPTAGLHLTQAALDVLRARGVEVARLLLHVGLGTFRPVTAEDLDAHPMHSEELEVGEAVVDAVARARGRGAPVIAVGTTVVRALESSRDPARHGYLRATRGETSLLIQPGYSFGVVDGLLTNFHMPRSTLLALVAAFAGLERTLDAYRVAVSERYRFLSYGDAMWIPERTR